MTPRRSSNVSSGSTAPARALARGQLDVALADAAAMPGFARGILHDAIRSASTPAQLAALQPLADAIDAADRDNAMHDALARAYTDEEVLRAPEN